MFSGDKQQLLKTFGSSCSTDGGGGGQDGSVPSSVDWVRVDPAHFVAGYVNANAVIYDIETGKQVVKLDTLQVHIALFGKKIL